MMLTRASAPIPSNPPVGPEPILPWPTRRIRREGGRDAAD